MGYQPVNNLLMSILTHDVTVRAAKTFAQAFVAALMVTGFKLDTATLTAAGAAGLSAVWNYVKTL